MKDEGVSEEYKKKGFSLGWNDLKTAVTCIIVTQEVYVEKLMDLHSDNVIIITIDGSSKEGAFEEFICYRFCGCTGSSNLALEELLLWI
jgi:hypothetical protein